MTATAATKQRSRAGGGGGRRRVGSAAGARRTHFRRGGYVAIWRPSKGSHMVS
ncbi:MAG: hypothetical protein QF535_19760 [Anaerolineales bacterium]|nr:hypothetical protein [Anaerolineales bacterium]